MEIEQLRNGSRTTYKLSGRFDAYQVPKLKSAVEPLAGELELDLAGVNFIDSTGLAQLVSLYKRVREQGAKLTITNLQDPVRLILEVTQLITVLPIDGG